MLSDYFNINLDELVKDIDLEDIRSKNLTDEKIVSIFSDVEKTKLFASRVRKISCYLGVAILVIILIVFVLKLVFPGADFLWVIK